MLHRGDVANREPFNGEDIGIQQPPLEHRMDQPL
jgi:hypothetical protein